jgi:hypothetical protein
MSLKSKNSLEPFAPVRKAERVGRQRSQLGTARYLIADIRERSGVLTEQAQLHLLQDALFCLLNKQREVVHEGRLVVLRVILNRLLQLSIRKDHVVTTVTWPTLPIMRGRWRLGASTVGTPT